MEDLTGTPPSRRDVEEAIAVIQKVFVTQLHTLPIELAIQVPNIHRCLKRLAEIEPTFTSTIP